MSYLPKELNFGDLPPVLDSSVRSTTINILPSNNKASFTVGDIIDFDFPKQGFIDGKSVYLSYQANVTNGTGATNYMFCTPFCAALGRVEESCKSGTLQLNTIPQYNQLYNDIVQLKYSVADKYGNQVGLGFKNDNTNPKFDGRLLTASTAAKFFMSAPLYGLMLTNSEKFVSMDHLGGYRIKIYIENSLDKIFSNVAATTGVSAFTISNIQLTCDLVDVSSELSNMLRSQPYIIKTSTYALATQPVPTGSNGSLQLSYANNFSSLKHVLIHPSGSTSCTNKAFDAVDITADNDNIISETAPKGGSYQIQVGNIVYPQVPLNSGTNRAQIYQELKKAVGILYGNNNLSINSVEFNYGTDSVAVTSTTEPGKFILAVDTSRISATSSNLLNGISTKNTPINLLLNMAEATAEACTVTLMMNYDVLINVDPVNNQVSLSV